MKTKRKYNVIFRACDKVNAVNKKARPFDLTKAQLIKICFLSLLETFEGFNYKLIVIGDNLSDELLQFFGNFKVEMRLGIFGNDGSIRESLKIASIIPSDEWIYFCEDDYLHNTNSIAFIDNYLSERSSIFRQAIRPNNLSSFINLSGKDLFIFPPDYPDRYAPKYIKHSIIVCSSDCHWRQVTNVTFTFLTKSSTVKRNLSVFSRASVGAKDKWMSRKLFGRFGFFAGSICFSPMPGLSTHMHKDTMTPLIDWEKITEKYLAKI